ncbi:uncharacterized protein LOC143177395 isoform X2 [Calliopsis andreniformis]|uniref:uncharacterized protein LOC143177395 isoform X2 n=1 Tax=Calliopsis andreniformis TaxID=337506 RepID=UPI003FCE3BFE
MDVADNADGSLDPRIQVQCQQQAQLFQRASEIHAAAKETVALAESRFISHQHEWNFDQAWQDMLNHATIKVMDAENQKAECRREHYRRAVLFHNAEERLLQLEEKHRRSIIKTRPYFEVKAQCEQMLATQKERVECLQKAIQEAKANYATSLRRLEEISNQIHQQRRDYDFIANGPREPGVGAELVSPQKSAHYDTEFNQANDNAIKDITNEQLNKCSRLDEYNSNCQLQEDSEHIGKRSVDGSEATSPQWELELQAKMENLNALSSGNSMHDHSRKNENISNICSYNEDNAKSSSLTQESGFKFLQNRGFSVNNFNQFQKLLKNLQTLKNPLANMSSFIEGSNTLKNDIDSNLKDNTSKSLSNSPAKTSINLESKFAEKVETRNLAKYVPNRIFDFGFNYNKSRSNSDINVPSNLDTNPVGIYQSLDRILDDKTDNFEFSKDVELESKNDEVKETYNNGLHSNKNLHCSQLNNKESSQLKEILSGEKRLRSNSLQILSNNSNTSPVKLKDALSLSSENSLNKKLTSSSNRCYEKKEVTDETSNISEFPLLSFLEKTNSLADSKNRSYSMVNLDDKRNIMLLNDVHLNNVKTKSIDRLANTKNNLLLKAPR